MAVDMEADQYIPDEAYLGTDESITPVELAVAAGTVAVAAVAVATVVAKTVSYVANAGRRIVGGGGN